MSPRFTYCRKFWTLSLPFFFSCYFFFDILLEFPGFLCTSLLIFCLWDRIFIVTPFWSFFVSQLSWCLTFWYIILLDFHGICIFHITVALQYFLVTLPFYRQYLMFDFPHIFHFYTVLQIPFYHRITFSLPLFSFLDFHNVFLFEESNLSTALLIIDRFVMNIL